MRLFAMTCLAASCLLTGCAFNSPGTPAASPGVAFSGTVHGGQQPIAGARIYLLAPSAAGYGSASTSLLTAGIAGTDSIGGYVLSDANGNFSVTGDYTCTPATQAYLYATGGNPGAGTNAAVGLMTVLGTCPIAGTFALADPLVTINEVSTVAAAYAMAGYATDATHVASSGSTAALQGLRNAFAAAANLTGLRYGNAYTTTPNGNGTVPQAEINTLANIIAACINSTGTQAACTTLLTAAPNTAGTKPTETATAAINIAHRPAVNVATLYNLQPASGAPFMPTLTAAPNDFSLGIVWNISSSGAAFDSSNNLWTLANGILEYSNAGALLSPAAGYPTSGGVPAFGPVLDPTNNIWFTTFSSSPGIINSSITKISNGGNLLSPVGGYIGGGLNQPQALAIDGNGYVWAGNLAQATVSRFTSTGSPVSGSPYPDSIGSVVSLAVDNLNDLWVASANTNNSLYSLSLFNSSGVYVRSSPSSGSAEQSNLSIDASNNIWGTRYSNGSTNLIFKYSYYAVAPTGFPITGNTAVQQCLQTQIDGDGNLWCASDDDSIAEISPTGGAISPTNGYVVPNAFGPEYIAIDGAGNVWTTGNYYSDGTNFYGLTVELIGAAAPVVTPLSLAIQQGKLGSRP